MNSHSSRRSQDIVSLLLRSRGPSDPAEAGATTDRATKRLVWLAAAACLVLAAESGRAAEAGLETNRFRVLAQLKLEDVLNTEVTSVSKRPEKLFDAAAAVFVIGNEDIRRSGARSFPELFRMSPGTMVAQLDAHDWAMTMRGANSFFANHLLVLRDGRTLYSPFSGGVNWDIQQYLFEDIERIEMIRGPGGALWGANAVNGVINIITKDAKDTQGLYVSGGGGTEERGFFGARYGDRISENGYLRGYVTGYDRQNFPGGHDDSRFVQGGFRSDWHGDQNHYTLQGDYFSGQFDVMEKSEGYPTFQKYGSFPFLPRQFESSGGNVLFRFNRQFSEESDLEVQAYYDRLEREFIQAPLTQEIFDVEYKHRFPLPGRQNLMYGGGYRYQPDELEFTGTSYAVTPSSRRTQVFNTFVQDEITLVEDRLRVTLGSKFEHNDFTGWEVQPSGRLAWTPSQRQTVWTAVSRAAQVPVRGTVDGGGLGKGGSISSLLDTRVPVPGLGLVPTFLSSLERYGKDVTSQRLMAYELGYRIEATERVFFDLAGFYHDYEKLHTFTTQGPYFLTNPFTNLVFGALAGNEARGESYGFEVASDWRVTDWWRLAGAYTFFKMDTDVAAPNRILLQQDQEPVQQVSLRSSMDLHPAVELDIWGRFVDQLAAFNVGSYFDLDVRLAWKPVKNLELAVVGQNLVESERFEFTQEFIGRVKGAPVPRGVYAQVSYRY